jgi:hypothetical protein
MSSISLRLDGTVVKVQVVLGCMGGTVSLEDSENGTTLILLVTNPSGPSVRITGCFGKRKKGWRARRRERFSIEMHGLPHDFAIDGNRALAWLDVAALPSMQGLTKLYVEDSSGGEWPVEDQEHLMLIVDRLTRPKTRGATA